MGARVFIVDPLADSRWDDLLARHPRASAFHSRGWLEALKRTYGYEPVVLTTTERGPLENGLAVCRVKTWLSRRLVSLPFSDHCDPLVDCSDDLAAMIAFLVDEVRQGGWRSFELRPRAWELPPGGVEGSSEAGAVALGQTSAYTLHAVDLRGTAGEIFRRLHPSCTRRAIRRAEREGLQYDRGRSDSLLAAFYGLFRLTRHRLGLPPQPLSWFRNLVTCLGEAVTIHTASKDGKPVAAILTLSFKRNLVYKFGGSDAHNHRLGGMPFLFWRAIQDARDSGVEEFDLGRSDLNQPGLIAFKDHLGAPRSTLTYFRHPAGRAGHAGRDRALGVVRRVFAHLPDSVLDLAGKFFYRHLG